MRPPRKLSTEEQLYPAALRILMRRGHSVYEMRQALERRCDDGALVRRVLDRLKQEKLLDDARYSLEFARSRARNRKQGRFRIVRELRARGVPERHIEVALNEAFGETDERELLRKRIERKLRLLRGPLDEKKRASMYHSLLRAGFQADEIRAELKSFASASSEAPGELPAIDDAID